MTDAEALAEAEAHIARLEEIVADYALRYGLSDCARVVFGLKPARGEGPRPDPVAQTSHSGDPLPVRPPAPRWPVKPTR